MKENPGKPGKTDAEIVEEIRKVELAKLPVLRRPCFIEDGYTIPGAVNEIVQTDEFGREVSIVKYDFKFNFRPLNAKEKKLWAEVPEKESDAYDAKMMSERISTWNLRDEKNNIIPINIENIDRLDPDLYNYVKAIILSLAAYANHADNK